LVSTERVDTHPTNMSVTLDTNGQDFGGISVDVGSGSVLLQDFSVTEGTNIIELEGDQGQVVAQAFVQRPREMSGTAVSDGTGTFTRGDEFTYNARTWMVIETTQNRSNGAFATQGFTAREKIND
jgi:hypothetical protein